MALLCDCKVLVQRKLADVNVSVSKSRKPGQWSYDHFKTEKPVVDDISHLSGENQIINIRTPVWVLAVARLWNVALTQ